MKLISPTSSSSFSSITPRLTLFLLYSIFFFFVTVPAAHSSVSSSSPSSHNYSSNTVTASDIVADAEAATTAFMNHTAISEFRLLNRKYLLNCPDFNPYIKLSVKRPSGDDYSDGGQLLPDEELVTVQVDGVLFPSHGDWVALVSTSHSDVSGCLLSKLKYSQTGDFSKLPLLCHYPVKAQYLSSDPDYPTCLSQLQMRVTWVSGDKTPQQVRYDNGRSQISEVTTFTQDQMCMQ